MATTHVIGHAASPELIKLLQNIVSSVLDDEGFNLLTEECKRSLELARFLTELCSQALPSCCSHAKLVDKLNKLIDSAKMRESKLINEEKLWSTYHKLHIYLGCIRASMGELS